MKKNSENIFDRATGLVNKFEDSFVNFVSVIVPWFVPLIPAVILYDHLIEMGWRGWVAFIAAAVVEALGLSTVNTYFRFANHNKRYKDEKNKMPVWVVIVAYVWYLVIVLFVNVVFDWVSGVNWTRIVAVTAFSTLSLPASALISVRGMFAEWKGEREQKNERQRTKANKTNEPDNKTTNETNEQRTKANEQRTKANEQRTRANEQRTYRNLGEDDKDLIIQHETKSLALAYGVTERAIQKWRERILDEREGVNGHR